MKHTGCQLNFRGVVYIKNEWQIWKVVQGLENIVTSLVPVKVSLVINKIVFDVLTHMWDITFAGRTCRLVHVYLQSKLYNITWNSVTIPVNISFATYCRYYFSYEVLLYLPAWKLNSDYLLLLFHCIYSISLCSIVTVFLALCLKLLKLKQWRYRDQRYVIPDAIKIRIYAFLYMLKQWKICCYYAGNSVSMLN
jgi:hypothetical protein